MQSVNVKRSHRASRLHEPERGLARLQERQMRLAFVMELQAGMRTHYLNWRRIVEQESNVTPTWVPISYCRENGWIERIPFLPGKMRAAWRSYLEVEQGLGREKYDGVLFNTHNPAVVHGRSVHEQHAFLMFDVTPRQYDALGHWYAHAPDRPGWLADYKHRRVRATFQAAVGIFPWSNWAAQSAIEEYGVASNRVHILPPGVDTMLWHPGSPDDRPQDDILRILFTGGNFERKGGDLLLRWAKETPHKGWELHLVTQDKVEAPPGVYVHNNLGSNAAELISLAQRCDIFALPTRADCFSIASLEAMAVGLPVITTCVGGIPDIVRDGETGYLLAPDDYDGLCDRLDSLLRSAALRCSMGSKGREVACQQFEARTLVRRGLQIMTGTD